VTTAKAIAQQFLADLNHIDRCVDLFAEDGVFEFPYLHEIGQQTRFEGKDAIRSLFERVLAQLSPLTFRNIVIHEMVDPSRVFVEYESKATIKATGHPYIQKYVSLLTVHDGKITLVREYLDIIATARMLLPNGLADVPSPGGPKPASHKR
jgi:ketosteroid isomerase-like protein